ncbi:MAG: hypothetical protein ACI4WX_07830, partial [Aristaeellaceae bacterium]
SSGLFALPFLPPFLLISPLLPLFLILISALSHPKFHTSFHCGTYFGNLRKQKKCGAYQGLPGGSLSSSNPREVLAC